MYRNMWDSFQEWIGEHKNNEKVHEHMSYLFPIIAIFVFQ